MKDKDKTHGQLIKEVTSLHQRIAQLEGCERQRKEVEETLTRWDQEKAAILGSMSELVAYQDTRMRILWANRAAAESVGMDPQQLVGRHCYEIWPQRQRPCVGCPVVKARKSGQPQEAETTSPDGRVWLIKGYPVRDKKGIVSGVVEVTLEITDRKQAEEALRKSEDKYRTILKNIEEGYYEVDLAGNFTFFNYAMCRIWGYPKEELMGMNNRQYTDKENAKRLFQAFNKVYRTGKPGRGYDYEIIKKDGTRSYAEASISLRKDSSGKAIGFRGIIRDITFRKRAEEALKESEEKFRLAFENANTGVCLVDLEGNLTRVNSKMCEIFGYTKKELEHMTVNDIAHPEDVDLSPEFMKKTLRGEIDRATFEKQYLHKKGHVVTCEVSSSLVRDYEGTPLYFISHVNDITERKQAEEKLRENEERYRAIFEQAADSIVLVDTETGALVEFNNRAHENLGYTREEFEKLKLTAFEIIESAEEVAKHIEKIVKEGTDIFETKQRAKGGEIRDIQVSSKAISIQGKDFLYSIWRDITERKQAEEALRENEERYKTLFDEAVGGICLTDAETGIIIDCNEAMAALVGRKRADLIGKSQKILHPPQDNKEAFSPTFKQHLTDKEGLILETQVVTKTGDLREVEIKANLLELQGRKVLQGLFHDITEHKRAEEALRENEQRYRGLFEGAAEGILIADLKSKQFLYANPSMCNMLGYSEEELSNLSVRDIHPSESLGHVISEFEAQGRDEKTLAPAIPCVRKDGTILYTDITTSKILIDGKECNVGFFTDITERKRAEEALRESETRFRTLFEAIPDTVLVHDDKGAILHINEIGAQRLEWSSKDLVGRNLREIVTPENAASIADHARETHKVGWNRFETTYISRSGWRTMAEVYEHPIVFGTKKAILSVARDITERKKADEVLREKEETIRALVETSQDWIWSIDVQGIHTYSNPAVEKILGYTPDDLIGKSSLKLMHEEDRRAVEANLTQWIKEKSGWQNIILRWRHKDGSWRWLESNAVPICDVTGELIGFRGVDRDITERKQTEEALLNEKIFSDTVMDSSPGLFFVFDDEGNILRWNRNVEKFTEYSTQEISKMNVFDFVVQEDKKSATEAIQEALNKGQASAEITILSKSGKKIPFYLTGLRTHIENITCVVGSGFDITEIKQTEEALQRSYDQLQKTFISAINALASTVEMKDQYTAGHQPRVTQLSCAIAEEMGLSKDQIEGIRMAGLIHDIGKIVVPAEILNKPGPLTEVQYEMIKMHPQAGYDILQRIAFPWPVAQIVQQHHEMMDGSGYPQGLAGEGILPEARIMAVANVVEAMTAHRPYRPAYDIEEALAEISHNRGTKYDSAAVDACLRLFTERGFAFDSAQY